MQLKLTDEQKQMVLETIKWVFPDFHPFDAIVRPQLKQAIDDSHNIDINTLTVRKSVERYYDIQEYKTGDRKQLINQIRTIFMATYILMLTFHGDVQAKMINTVEELINKYPNFNNIPIQELQLLLKFRNMLRVAITVIPPYRNRDRIWEIATRLEGARNEYVRGSGQRKQVDWRMEIFSVEGGEPEKRPWQQGKRVSKLALAAAAAVPSNTDHISLLINSNNNHQDNRISLNLDFASGSASIFENTMKRSENPVLVPLPSGFEGKREVANNNESYFSQLQQHLLEQPNNKRRKSSDEPKSLVMDAQQSSLTDKSRLGVVADDNTFSLGGESSLDIQGVAEYLCNLKKTENVN